MNNLTLSADSSQAEKKILSASSVSTEVAENKNTEPVTFENTLSELETIVQAIENNRLPLENMLEQYQRGVELAKKARERLEWVEVQIQILDNNVLQPLVINPTDGEPRP